MDEKAIKDGQLVTIYDPACGSGGMLTSAKEFIDEEIIDSAPRTEGDIRSFARKFNTHPAVIIGRLQHDNLFYYGLGRQFLKPVEFN